MEKDRNIQDLKDTVEILELKIAKLEQLVRLKDSKISKLQVSRSYLYHFELFKILYYTTPGSGLVRAECDPV